MSVNDFSRRLVAIVPALVAVLAFHPACSDGARQANPVAPSAVTAATAPREALDAAGSHDRTLPPESPGSGLSGPMDVTFPPRNEALQFRTALETKYRDGLRRGAVQTFVDQEGTVVWAQEYLRYRVNLCSHAAAVTRVFQQIDGQGVQPICGTTATVIFPPRNEPLDFMLQLEAKYRDGLGRGSGPSFVDVEGNIVWTQEYLRYRVSACSHGDAQQKVFDQIDGRGVQGDCSSPAFSGTWRGSARAASCTGQGPLGQVCTTVPVIDDTLTLRLTQAGTVVTGTLNYGGYPANVTGTATGNQLSISGQFVSSGISVAYSNWETSLSGSSMVGRFRMLMTGGLNAGFAQYFGTLTSVSKTARVSDASTASAGDLSSALRRASRIHSP